MCSFPRTIPQAEALEKHMHIHVVVDLNIPDEVRGEGWRLYTYLLSNHDIISPSPHY
jgi:adenylate kinase family enzyme